MPSDLDTYIFAADAAAKHAAAIRALHRRRTRKGAYQREEDIRLALDRLKGAMEPLKSYLCRIPYEQQTQTRINNQARARRASDQLQRERRKLWKMLNNPKESYV